MKNIHILPTDKPSRLVLDDTTQQLILINKGEALWGNRNIYIINDEEIKEGDWVIYNHELQKSDGISFKSVDKKIILTTDQDLIKDGVQAIDDEFLEWFVKNQSCEWVEVKSWAIDKEWDETYKQFNPIYPQKTKYKIIIPKEELTISDEAKQRAKNYMSLKGALEPKQETLEEANWKVLGTKKDTFYNGAKWQAERMYSEEEVFNLLCKMPNYFKMTIAQQPEAIKDWFEQFKKK